MPDCFSTAWWEQLHQINISICEVKSNWKLLPICGCSQTQKQTRWLAGWLACRQAGRAKGCFWQNQIRVVCYLPHNEKSNRFLCLCGSLLPNILAMFNCVRQLKPSLLLRFHPSSEKYSCSNPLINVCLGDVSMETVFTALQCSKNGSKVITVPD